MSSFKKIKKASKYADCKNLGKESLLKYYGVKTERRGTIISMGTPAGVGMGMIPPRFLMPGDVVKCDVEGIGMITNVVV